MVQSQGHDARDFVRLRVAGQGAVAKDRLGDAGRTNAQKLNTQTVGHGVLLDKAKHLVAGVAEVSHASQRDAEALGGSHGLVEALGLVVVGVDVLRGGVRLQGSSGQTSQADAFASAIQRVSRGVNGQGRGVTANIGHGHSASNRARGANERSGVGTGNGANVHVRRKEGNDVEVVPECSREICHSD